jgi:hypothetical protein
VSRPGHHPGRLRISGGEKRMEIYKEVCMCIMSVLIGLTFGTGLVVILRRILRFLFKGDN